MNNLKAVLAMILLSAVMPVVLIGLVARWVDNFCVALFEKVYAFACETLLLGEVDEEGKCEKKDDDR